MVKIVCVPSSASATEEAAGNVIVSGSYGGEYNAFHAAKRKIRGVILNDCGVGRDNAGIKGLPYLDHMGLAGATADVWTSGASSIGYACASSATSTGRPRSSVVAWARASPNARN